MIRRALSLISILTAFLLAISSQHVLGQEPTASAYQTCVSDRTSVRKAVLAMHETIVPRRLSLAG